MKSFSFIIPVFNCEKYLPECVDSIHRIGLKEYEILLVDDGSTDRSGQLCDELAAKYDAIYCIHQENQGVSVARNHGLQAASGDYVIFLDSDDTIDPVKMATLLHVVGNDNTIDLTIFGMSFDYFRSGKCYRNELCCYPREHCIKPLQWQESLLELFEHNSISSSCNKIFKQQILKEHGIYFNQDMFLYEDLEFVLHYLSHCKDIYNTSEIIYHYRQSEDEGNAGRRLSKIEHIPALIEQIEAALDNLILLQHAQAYQENIKGILLTLYIVLAREKISVSDRKGVRQICDDFVKWSQRRDLQIPKPDQDFVDQLLNRKVFSLIFRRNYTLVRHKIAVFVKQTRLYQTYHRGG